MNKSPVYFVPVAQTESVQSIQTKIKTLIDKSGLFNSFGPGKKAVIKMHFGEQGNKGFVKPEYVLSITEKVKEKGSQIVLSDTNTLYKGRRTKSSEHTALAHEHGFTMENTGAEVVVPKDIPEEVAEIAINQQHIQTAKVAKMFLEYDYLIDVSHFKGHLMTGFGGALKNIGMGCASREGKLAQHSGLSPRVITENCVACGACVKICPVAAISLVNKKAVIDEQVCVGCASCLAACEYHAMDVKWESGSSTIQLKMVEYAKAILNSKKDAAFFINFAMKITKECDCLAKDDPRIVDDIGIFVSCDPVSVDKACYDMAVKKAGRDIFKESHPNRDGMQQLRYAAELGLGSLEYELIEC